MIVHQICYMLLEIFVAWLLLKLNGRLIFNIAKRLFQIDDEHIYLCRDFITEQQEVLKKLNMSVSDSTMAYTGRHLRKLLREEAFMRWSALPHKGKGVITYQQDPKANAWFT